VKKKSNKAIIWLQKRREMLATSQAWTLPTETLHRVKAKLKRQTKTEENPIQTSPKPQEKEKTQSEETDPKPQEKNKEEVTKQPSSKHQEILDALLSFGDKNKGDSSTQGSGKSRSKRVTRNAYLASFSQ